MKVFQIEANICFRDWTRYYKTRDEALHGLPDSDKLTIVEGPDDVFEGWGYVGGVFIKPTPPEGWLYDEQTGTFYRAS